jgi:NADPH-dependent glutamate synthase beta subunit-like oxidoreductase
MAVNVAIVGSGPAGFYTAEALLQGDGDVRVDIIERLPTPFGLIRAGVAPDHQTTKKVAKKFESTALREIIRYYGNVEIGRDLHLNELRDMYDAVVLAVGSPSDRPLGILGEDKQGVYGSGAFVGWYNGHPDFRDLDPDLDTRAAVIIGAGNVALDVARVLVKSETEMAVSDLADYAAEAIRPSAISDVYLLGRRGPIEAKFTNVELREMGQLEGAVPQVDPSQFPDRVGDLDDRDRRLAEKNLKTFREFANRRPDEKPKRVHFKFYAAPVEVLGGDMVEGVRFERTRIENGRAVGTGEFEDIACGLVIAAIGYRASRIEGVPFDPERGLIPNDDGRIAPGLYAVGWAKRGPTGVIATNRPDGVTCAEQIQADIPDGIKPGRKAMERLLAKRKVRAVSYDDWQRIDAAEVASATGPAPRRKFTTLREMLAVLDGSDRDRSTG